MLARRRTLFTDTLGASEQPIPKSVIPKKKVSEPGPPIAFNL